MQPFAFLTTQGRARRLRALALEALNYYDIDVARIRLVSNETNCTFRIDTVDGGIYALRIGVPDVHSNEEIEAEIAWQLAIARETDIPVALPLPSRSGDNVVTAGARGVPEERQCVLFSWAPGRMLAANPTPEGFETFGRLSARLHAHGRIYIPPIPAAIRQLDRLYPFGDPEQILNDKTRSLFSAIDYKRLLEMRSACERELTWLYQRDTAPQIVHGDLHGWNVMNYRGQLKFIDFEDLCWAYPVQDIAITLYYAARSKAYANLRAAFERGYETEAIWPEMYPGQIELHMVHRAIDLFNFVLGSAYRADEELLSGFVQAMQGHHAEQFEIWKSRFKDEYYA